jgi:3-deoxy-manno-octulosonate cytidylyltransferase (CMP-KDO synthetase)|tara:strand:+ start:2718 stop:3449 length:732 start_codon:yes stop_codon:yes gene_type:complete
MKTLVIIPSRLSATRLPGKPLLKIEGLSIISRVFKRAEKANIGEVIVATEDNEIIEDVKKNGGNAILTSKQPKTGTDRIYEAFKKLNRNDVDFIMNIQGDEPEIDITDIKKLHSNMKESKEGRIGTLATKIFDNQMYKNQNVVKVKIKESFDQNPFPLADNFFRKIEKKENIFHHIGIYCYKVETLKKFVSYNQSKNELINRLEQLRAIDNNININVAKGNSSPIGIDTKEDYLALKKILEYK